MSLKQPRTQRSTSLVRTVTSIVSLGALLIAACVIPAEQQPSPNLSPRPAPSSGPPGMSDSSHSQPPRTVDDSVADSEVHHQSDQPRQPTPQPAGTNDHDPSETKTKSSVARQMLDAANRLRAAPATFASEIETFRSYYDGHYIDYPGREVRIITNEGIALVDEAIQVAKAAKPVQQLRWSDGLAQAALAHAIEIGRAGHIEHVGADGSQPFDRMQRHGRVGGYSGENIGTGDIDGTNMIISLFVDDGVPSRGHRKLLLAAPYAYVGIGCAPHVRYKRVCVMDLAESFQDSN